MSHHDDLQPDLQPVIDQLRANRPEATALELDGVKQQVLARVATPARRRTRRSELMKSRLVVLTTLVLGMLLSTAGAGLAVSGISGNAAEDQYETPTPSTSPTGGGGVLGDEDTGTGAQPDDEAGGGASRRRRGHRRAAVAPGRGGRQRQRAAVHRLRGRADPARRPRAADRGPRAAAPFGRGQLARAPSIGRTERRAAARLSSFSGLRDLRPRRDPAPAGRGSSARSPRSRSRASGSSGLRRRARAASARGSCPASACVTASPYAYCQLSGSRATAERIARTASAFSPARASQ